MKMRDPSRLPSNSEHPNERQASPLVNLWRTLMHPHEHFSARERQGLQMAVAVLILAFCWRFGWVPLQAYFSPPGLEAQNLATQLESLERQQLEVNAIRAMPIVPLAQSQKSFEQITHNLMPQAQLRFNDHQANVSLGAVSPQDLAKWLQSLKEQTACRVVQSDLARTQMPSNTPSVGASPSNPLKGNTNSNTNSNVSAVLWTGRLVFEFAKEP